MDFVHVAAGAFAMGSDDGHPSERPVHVVWLDAFLIALRPLTNADYAAYLESTGAPPPAFWGKPGFSHPRQPVVGLSWPEAVAAAAWAGAIHGGRPRAPGGRAGAAPGATRTPGAPSVTALLCRRISGTPTTVSASRGTYESARIQPWRARALRF